MKNLLQRVSVALEMGGIATYEKSELITRKLISALTAEPPDSRYEKVSVGQLRAAWFKIYEKMADRCRRGVRPGVNGIRPFDEHVEAIIESNDVSLLLQFLPAASKSSGGSSGGGKRERENSVGPVNDGAPSKAALKRQKKRLASEKMRGELDAAKASNNPSSGSRGGQGGAGSSGGGGNANRPTGPKMPRELIGKQAKTSSGEVFCFAYNLGGCPNAGDGEKCPRGWHLCMEPGCGAKHGLKQHA